MQLKIQRSQRESGVVSRAVVFCVDARAYLTPQEQANVTRYRLGSQVIYSSEAAKKHAEGASSEHFTSAASWVRGLYHAAALKLNLTITIDSIQRGQHIECKDLQEVRGAEEALVEACQSLKNFLATAATFDGGEDVYDFSGDEPKIITQRISLAPPLTEPVPIVQPHLADTPAQPAEMPPAGTPYAMSPATMPHTWDDAPKQDPMQNIKKWWFGMTDAQRKFAVLGAGIIVVMLIIALH